MWYIVSPRPGRGDQTETGDKTEGTPRCRQEGNDGDVCCSGACVERPPPNPQGGNHSAGPWQRTGGVSEGGTPSEERFNRDGGLEVPCCWTAVMRRQRASNPHQPLTSNDMYP